MDTMFMENIRRELIIVKENGQITKMDINLTLNRIGTNNNIQPAKKQ